MHISDTFLIVIAVGPNLPSHFASYRFNLTDLTASRAYSKRPGVIATLPD